MTLRSPSKQVWQATHRDFAILADIGEYGILTTKMVHKRHWPDGTSLRACQVRLSVLRDDGFIGDVRLAVTKSQSKKVEPYDLIGPNPTGFVLLPKGAEFLESHAGTVAKRVSQSKPAALTLLHRLNVVACRLSFDAGFGQPTPRWIFEQDCVPGCGLAESAENRHILYERFRLENRDAWVRPDASSLIRFEGATGSSHFVVAYWEIDRSTNSLDKEMGKSTGYQCLIRTGAFRRHWPELAEIQPDAVRVFYVCESQKRIDQISNVLRGHGVAPYYRFAVREELLSSPEATARTWQDTEGEKYSILRRPNS